MLQRNLGKHMNIEHLNQVVVATGNTGKYKELAQLLNSLGITAIFGKDLGLIEPEETGKTFAANAIIKAEAACKATGETVIADDSGFCVSVLGDAPGIYSARWGKQDDGSTNFEQAMQQVADEIADLGLSVDGQDAWFGCALSIASPKQQTQTWFGKCNGKTVWPLRGTQGFGYDPMFAPEDLPIPYSKTFGEISAQEKHGVQSMPPGGLSHRARAFFQMQGDLRKILNP